MQLEGIHHVTCITADCVRNADFYVRVLGLRVVKKTINQVDQTTYHLFYGDERASYGNNISFFEYRGRPDGVTGGGDAHTIVWRVGSAEALDFWHDRLAGEGYESERGETTLLFCDFEGLRHELAVVETDEPALIGESPDIPAELALQGIHGVRAYANDIDASTAFLTGTLGFAQDGDRFTCSGRERSGFYTMDPAPAAPRVFGAGTVQHVAWGCTPEDIDEWSGLVDPLCADATGTIDRHFFRSTYFTEPGGVLFEIAERGGPGFIVDEPSWEQMGDRIELPPFLEERRILYDYHLTKVPTTDELRAGVAAPEAAAPA